MHVEMAGDACAGGLAEIHAEVDAVRGVEAGEDALGVLGEADQFVGGADGERGEAGFVRVGDDHDVTGGVGEGVEADEAVDSAVNDAGGGFGDRGWGAAGDGVVDGGEQVAEDAAGVAGPGGEAGWDATAHAFIGGGDVTVAPWGPEQIHDPEYRGSKGNLLRARAAGCPDGRGFPVFRRERASNAEAACGKGWYVHQIRGNFLEYTESKPHAANALIDLVNRALLHCTCTLMHGFQHRGAATHWPIAPCQVIPTDRFGFAPRM